MSTRLTLAAALLVALATLPRASRADLAAVQTTPQTPPSTAQPASPNMQAMMQMHQQMMAEMKAADAKLDGLVQQMNSAAGESRITAVIAVVNELASQHKSMHGHMGQMHEMMMGGRGMMMKR